MYRAHSHCCMLAWDNLEIARANWPCPGPVSGCCALPVVVHCGVELSAAMGTIPMQHEGKVTVRSIHSCRTTNA